MRWGRELAGLPHGLSGRSQSSGRAGEQREGGLAQVGRQQDEQGEAVGEKASRAPSRRRRRRDSSLVARPDLLLEDQCSVGVLARASFRMIRPSPPLRRFAPLAPPLDSTGRLTLPLAFARSFRGRTLRL